MDKGWTQEQEAIERGNIIACFGCAKANGYTDEEADHCNDGDLGCKGCPFKEGRE